MSFTITCGWCARRYTEWQNSCDSCGGALPPPPGQTLGDPPPPPPRVVPKSFAFRAKWSRNFASIFGAIWFAVGLVIFIPFLFVLPFAAPFPLLFVIAGWLIMRAGRRSAARRLRAFVHGTAVPGQIAAIEKDTFQSMNGQHPWKLTYTFTVDGHLYEGVVTSWDANVSMRAAGQPVWVLYAPDDPAVNTLYPPIS